MKCQTLCSGKKYIFSVYSLLKILPGMLSVKPLKTTNHLFHICIHGSLACYRKYDILLQKV